MFIEKLMKQSNNYFMHSQKYNTYEISNGNIQSDLNVFGYILIVGSIQNDGVYKVINKSDGIALDEDLLDETFKGYIVQLAPPKEFIELAKKLETYDKENPVNAYKSESMPNYSYTLSDNQKWEDMFSTEISKYKKLPVPLCEMIARVKNEIQ